MKKKNSMKILACTAVLACGMAVCASAASFTDVPADAWYAAPINALADQGIVSGRSSTVFDPQGKVTRAEFVKMLALSSGDSMTGLENKKEYYKDQQIFLDAASSDLWFTPYANWGYDKWVVDGDASGDFLPNKLITRQEAAAMLSRYLKYKYDAMPQTNGAKTFTDAGSIASWAKEEVTSCTSCGVMQGDPGGTFRPTDSITRAEAAQMVKNAQFSENSVTQPAAQPTFSDNLQHLAGEKTENFTLSPYSVRLAVAMAANGANGQTKTQLLDALKITDLNAFNKRVKEQIADYASYSEKISLNVANSIWVNTDNFGSEDADFIPAYKTTLADFYSATASKVTSDTLVKSVNDWVSDKTNKKIEAILPDMTKQQLDGIAGVLVNAVYFKAEWENQFNGNYTKEGNFTNTDGTVSQIDMMHQTGSFPYYSEPGVQVLEMPYQTLVADENGIAVKKIDANLSMFIILTDSSDFQVENLLNSAKMKQRKVQVVLPKFKVEYDKELSETFKQLGATLPFDNNADFHSMFSEQYASKLFWIDKILHKTYIDVNEKGTEAAASTAVMMGGSTSSIPPRWPAVTEFTADRPFYFAIRDNKTGEILFVGRYATAK